MKRLLRYSLIAGLLVTAACTKDLETDDLAGTTAGGPVFHASFDAPSRTRTSLSDNDSKEIYWSQGDEISIFDGDGTNFEFMSSADAPAATTDFSAVDGTASLSEPDDCYYALYPYDASASISGGTITTTYPSSFQMGRYGSFQDGMNLAVASSSSYILGFKNLLGWIRLGMTGDDGITKIVFKGNNGEKLAGSVRINASDLSLEIDEEDAATELTFTGSFSSSESKDGGCYYYIPVLNLSFENGFTFIFYKDDGTTYTYSVSSPVSFERGIRRRLWVDFGTLTAQYTYTRVTASSPMNDGDEYILVYPNGDGTYKVFSQDIMMDNIEAFKGYGLQNFATSTDYRYGWVGSKIFNGDYVTVDGTDEGITIDVGYGIVVKDKSATMENTTASFPNSKTKTTGIKMTVTELEINTWTSSTKSAIIGGTLDSDDMYILADQILSRHSSYYSGWKWDLMISMGGGSLESLVANQYDGDYSFLAGYISSTYDSTSYEGFAFKDSFLYNPSTALKKIYLYRRTPSSN